MKSYIIDKKTGLQRLVDSRTARVLVALKKASWPAPKPPKKKHMVAADESGDATLNLFGNTYLTRDMRSANTIARTTDISDDSDSEQFQ